MTGFICHDDYYDRLKRLTDEEVGHLFRQLMLYHAGRLDEMEEFIDCEGIAFDFIKDDIDRMENKNETNKVNGSKGGRPKKQIEPKETEQNPTKPNKTEENPTKGYKDKDKDIDKDNKSSSSLSPSSFLDDDEAHRIQGDHDKVLDAAQNAGIALNRIVTARLIDLYGEYGLEKMLGAIDACARYAAPNLAYLEAVLKGSPKKAKPKVNAQDYEQRSYEEVSDEIMADQIREMEEWLKQSG